MRRVIHCPPCMRSTLGGEVPAGEHVKRVLGRLHFAVACDLCNGTMEEGDHAYAVSNWTDHGRPCYEWEAEYVEVPA